jgi:hypothetical protein
MKEFEMGLSKTRFMEDWIQRTLFALLSSLLLEGDLVFIKNILKNDLGMPDHTIE